MLTKDRLKTLIAPKKRPISLHGKCDTVNGNQCKCVGFGSYFGGVDCVIDGRVVRAGKPLKPPLSSGSIWKCKHVQQSTKAL